MDYGGDCRTAPATPGLLIILLFKNGPKADFKILFRSFILSNARLLFHTELECISVLLTNNW